MTDLKKQILDLMVLNRRLDEGHQYTVPSPESYPYQWFWDSCFHAIILSYFDTTDAKKELLSLTDKQFENGKIPHMIYWKKASETDFPVIEWGKEDTSTITQPPMLAYAVWQIYKKDLEKDGADEAKKFVSKIYPSLAKLYQYFLKERDPRGNNIVSIINPDESGEDNSPRFDIGLGLPPKQTIEINFKKRLELIAKNKECKFDAPNCMKNFFWVKDVPMNSILVENLKIMSDLAEILGKLEDADLYITQAKKITGGMRKLMLEDNIFWSVYLDPKKDTYEKIKVNTWAIFAPLFAGILTKKEADFVIKNYLTSDREYNGKFLVSTVSRSDPSFNPEGFWRGPVWFSVNWFIVKGLKKYGYNDLAKKITEGSLALIEKSGFREYYNPLTGEGLGAKNFTWGGLVVDMV